MPPQPNMQQLMKQAQQMQQQLMAAQAELAETEVEGSAGGGLVSAKMTGAGELLSLTIDPKAVERAKTTEAAAVVAELEKMNNETTLFGPRTFSKDLHHQNQGRYLIVDTEQGKPKVVDQWTISEKIPVDYLVSK